MTAIIFIIVISLLIFVHEAGHFFMAKRAGMRVDEFGFGFPPRLWGFKKSETVYSINWIPFGGFVRIYGEDGEHRDMPRSFGSKSIWSRMKVILAGVIMNFLFAAFLLMIGNFIGLRVGLLEPADIQAARDKTVQIIEVSAGSPAQTADLRVLDAIGGFKLANGSIFQTADPKAVQDFVIAHTGQTVVVVISRGKDMLEKNIALRSEYPAGQGPMGISLALTGVITRPWYESVWRGLHDAVILALNTVYGYYQLFKQLIVHGRLIADVSGPIGIASMTGQAARVGFNYLLQFIAIISVNLAVLNTVPFPALDGGRGLMLIIEKLRGSPINRKVEAAINAVGFSILVALMVIITARDIIKLF